MNRGSTKRGFMQPDNSAAQSAQNNHIRPARLVKHPRHFFDEGEWGVDEHNASHIEQSGRQHSNEQQADIADIVTQPVKSFQSQVSADANLQDAWSLSALPTTPQPSLNAEFLRDDVDISELSTRHIMRLSGMMKAVRPTPLPEQVPQTPANAAAYSEDGFWPEGIKQAGPIPVTNIYGSEPFGRTMPTLPVPQIAVVANKKLEPRWKTLLNSPAVKVALGLLIGIGMLYLVSKFINVSDTIAILKHSLTTPRGIALALLCGVAFLTAFCIRGLRWKLFLNPIGKVSTIKVIQLFLVGIFLNFLLPVRGGEVAKSLMLKRIANIPISRSLPTVAMDKALDLMPALFIMAIVPFLGIHMDIKLWLILGAVGGLLIGLIGFVAIAAWKRIVAIKLLQKLTSFLPKGLSSKVEGFATGFVDALLAGASQPKVFLPAVGLTIVAVIFDGLFAMLAFWTVGLQIPYGTAIFGYTVYNMFYILPTPPGQVGSNEAVGLLVFHGLLQQPAAPVTAMFVFSHPWTALIMTVSAMICLSGLGLTLSSAMKVQTEGSKAGDADTNAAAGSGQVVRA